LRSIVSPALAEASVSRREPLPASAQVLTTRTCALALAPFPGVAQRAKIRASGVARKPGAADCAPAAGTVRASATASASGWRQGRPPGRLWNAAGSGARGFGIKVLIACIVLRRKL